jgi:hypothetical protein
VFLLANVFAQGIVPDSLPVWNGYENEVETAPQQDVSKTENTLQTRGSKSLQTSIGNGGADIQQELRLSVQGEAANGIFVDAYLVDLGRPAGTEVSTTLREVDAAYIGVEGKWAKLELGDLNYEINNFALFGFRRQTLGASAKLKGSYAEASAIYGTDKTLRQSIVIHGQPSQQKGYLLFSDSAFGIIAPHTERVYLNGALLAYGKDYEINYAGGVLDFLGQIIPGPEDEIRVEYDSYSSLNSSELRGAMSMYRSKFVWLDIAAFNLRDSLKNDKMLGARMRSGNSFIFGDLETAMNENDSKAYRWFFESDSNSRQKSIIKVSVKGGFAGSDFAKPEYAGTENEWDAFILRDKWLLDSIPNSDLRYDEFMATMRLPFGFFPGFYIGHRNFESVRSEGFLRKETEKAESRLTLANINAKQGFANRSLWQGEIYSKFLQGTYRPYGNFRIDSEENLRSIYGLERGNENAGNYSGIEIMREQTDTNSFSNFKAFASFREKYWHTGTLFQTRKDSSSLSWLLDQNAGYNNPNSFLRGEAFYAFNYTNEVPWIPIYRRVPNGTGDVYYDSLSGQYISGADNGDFVYEGFGRADSLSSKSSKNNLRWNLSAYPAILVKKGFLSDMTFFANGEWLLHKEEKLLMLENSGLWEHPQNKGSLMLAISNKWDKEPQINFEEVSFGQELTIHYKRFGDYSLRLKREEAEFALSDLSWLSYEGELAWQKELGKGFSLSPFYSKKYTHGFYMEQSWNAHLQKGGINGKWQNEKGHLAGLGVVGNYVEKSSEISPYSAVDGFEKGFSWRVNTFAELSFSEHFYMSLQYVMRIWHSEVFQKLNLEAKAIF